MRMGNEQYEKLIITFMWPCYAGRIFIHLRVPLLFARTNLAIKLEIAKINTHTQ